MIKQELDFIWITSDGRRFLSKDEAVKHEELLNPIPDYDNNIVKKWLDKLKEKKWMLYLLRHYCL